MALHRLYFSESPFVIGHCCHQFPRLYKESRKKKKGPELLFFGFSILTVLLLYISFLLTKLSEKNSSFLYALLNLGVTSGEYIQEVPTGLQGHFCLDQKTQVIQAQFLVNKNKNLLKSRRPGDLRFTSGETTPILLLPKILPLSIHKSLVRFKKDQTDPPGISACHVGFLHSLGNFGCI